MDNCCPKLEQVDFAIDEVRFPLEGNRITLRKWTFDDANDLLEFRSQTDVMNPVGGGTLKTLEEAISSIEMIFGWYESKHKFDLAIYHRKDDKVIGTIGMKFKNISSNIIEIGYLLNKDYWNQGIMTEAVQLMIDYIRSISCTVKIVCMCNVNNLSSRKVVEKCKMKFSHEVQSSNHIFAVYEL